MGMRLDPVVAAAEFIRDMTDYTKKKSENAVFTVGKLTAKPGLSNVIAGSAASAWILETAWTEPLMTSRESFINGR